VYAVDDIGAPQLNIEHTAFVACRSGNGALAGHWSLSLVRSARGEGLLGDRRTASFGVAEAGIACADTLAVLAPEK
jgi:hypothetical protein